MKTLKDKPWYPLTVSICIGVILFVSLIKINYILNGIGSFLGFFSSVFMGAIVAYIINPLSIFFRDKIFFRIKKDKTKAVCGNICAFITVVVFLVFLLLLVIPQLVQSIYAFTNNLDIYIAGLQNTLISMGLSSSITDITSTFSTDDIVDTISEFVSENIDTIVLTTAGVGRVLGQIFIAFLLSMYFLAEKNNLKSGSKRFLKALFKDNYSNVAYVLSRSDKILNRYIVFNLLDALIIGIVNAIFMTFTHLPYIGLVSVIIAVTNIIPTFGPVIGALVGSFLLLLVQPLYAGVFLVFSIILQTLDGYVIKPKLFGDSLGVSGLWILIGIVAGGKMFGVVGILLAIPVVAILDMLYHEFLLPFLEKNK